MLERRLVWFAAIVSLWGGAVLCRLISLQIAQHHDLANRAASQQEATEDILAPRGAIFDRNGNPLALSEPKASIGVDPRHVDIAAASDFLSRVLHLDRAELASRMKWAYDHHKGYVSVKHRIADDEWQRLSLQPVNYWSVTQEGHRRYPNGPLLAHVLGSVDYEQKGNFGIEKYLDADLRGTSGKIRLLTDANKHGIESQPIADTVPGLPLTLTIDERIQYVAERELAAAAAAHQAPSGSVVVMNPYTGDILALASFPAFDPNQPPQPGEPAGLRMNHAVEAPFEPGSVFKVITLAAALETTNLTPDSMINCTATITPGGPHHRRSPPAGVRPDPHGRCAGEIEQRGRRAHRLAGRTGEHVPVRAEIRFRSIHRHSAARRIARPPAPHQDHRFAGFGGLRAGGRVTTLQLAQAASVVANGGLLVRPRLILKKGDRTMPPPAPERVLKPDTAITMRKMMEGVVVLPEGTGKRARLVGYTSGGKTGSAVIFDYATKRYTHSYNGSFMGFAPVTNPAIVVVVTLNGTHGDSGFGGAAAAPVFKEVATEALRVLEVPRDLPIEEPRPLLAKTDNLDAPARDSAPRPITEDSEDATAEAVAAPPAPGPKVPNFRGMTMRDVINQAAALGLTVLSDGSGLARKQDPPPGAPIRPGDRVSVVFAR